MRVYGGVHPYPFLQGVPGGRQESVRREDLLQGLALKYKEDASFALCVRRFLALAFVPLVEVLDYMDLILADEASKGDRLL